MSTPLAIAATTRVLAELIAQTIPSEMVTVLGTAPAVTSKAPDQLETSAGEVAQLALFLYHLTYNQGWREVGLPSRNGAGASIDRPPLALDLHYLLIAYGDAEFVPQVLLGFGMQALHETPFLYRQQINAFFTPPPALSPMDSFLATADLAGQVEMIKVTPEPLTIEDLSKLWTAFGGKYRPSVGYKATVVLIDSTAIVQSAPPVKTPTVTVAQLRQPVVATVGLPDVATVSPLYVPWQSTLTLVLTGENLTGDGVLVVFDGNPTHPQVPQATGPGGGQATTTVPVLTAGINTLRVVQQVPISSTESRNVVQSDPALFFLQPVIRQPTPGDYLITPGAPDPSQTPPTTPVTVQLDPGLLSSQKVQLLLNELAPPSGQAPLSFSFDAEASQIGANSVTFTTSGTRPGAYAVRVQVDGAQSVLEADYAHPAVTL